MTVSSPEGDAFTNLIIQIFRVNGLLLEAGDQLTQPVGLTSARWQVLGVVEHGPLSVAHVARSMGLARQSVQQTADGLEQDGFIAYCDNPFHRRSRLMQITPKGVAALDAIQQQRIAWAEAIAQGLTAADLRAAAALLEQLRVRLDQFLHPAPAANR